MTPRERTSLRSMGGPPHADIIAFYNQVGSCGVLFVAGCACIHELPPHEVAGRLEVASVGVAHPNHPPPSVTVSLPFA